MEVLEENRTNWLVRMENGSTETKTKSSDLNQLLYRYNLWGLLESGKEIWSHTGSDGEPNVTIVPDGTASTYKIQIGNLPDLTIGEHHKTDLIDALEDVHEKHNSESIAPIVALYDDIRKDMIRDEILDLFLDVFSDKVVRGDGGWFINGHLLLTYEGDFYHPSTESRKRSGSSVIGTSSTTTAYGISIDNPGDAVSRTVTLEGEEYVLTEKEMQFLGKAMWAIENTPDRRDA
jgi:hypothetical protein